MSRRAKNPNYLSFGPTETVVVFTKDRGELPEGTDPASLAHLASATIHTIAIRARARVPRRELEAIVKGALDVLCAAK